ncbi:MAG: pinensin family lanthipeptide [Bacteroidota bacterium]
MKKKMNLKNLKVESFVTKVNVQKSETVKGGLQYSDVAGISACMHLSACCPMW